MPEFTLTSPEGKRYTVTAPEGTTQQQAYETLQRQLDRPESGVLAGAGRFARGAARGIAGNINDAWTAVQPRSGLADVPGMVLGAVAPPLQALRLASQMPGAPPGTWDPHSKIAKDKLQEFANKDTPTGSEWSGWMASQALPAMLLPETGAAKGLKYAGSEFLKGVADTAGVDIPNAVMDWLNKVPGHKLAYLAAHYFGAPAAAHLGVPGAKAAAQAGARTIASEQEKAQNGSRQTDQKSLPQTDRGAD